MEIVENFRSIIHGLTETNIAETMSQIKNLDMNEDSFECLEYLFSNVVVNPELGLQYSDVCKVMFKGSKDKIMFKVHVEELAKMMVIEYMDEVLSDENECDHFVNSRAISISNFLGGLYSPDIISTNCIKELFEMLMKPNKECKEVLDLFKVLLRSCGHDLNNRAGRMKFLFYNSWMENQFRKSQTDASQKSSSIATEYVIIL